MSDRFRRFRGPALGMAAGIALTLGLVTTTGVATFGTQAAAASFPLADGASADADAGAAGTVQIQRNGDQLTITSLSPAAGWTPVVERQTGREVEVTFTNGDQVIHLDLELEDDEVRVDTGDDDGDDDDGTTTPGVPGVPTTYDAGAAGQVIVTQTDDGTLVVTDVLANDGWSVEIEEGEGGEVEVTFRNGDQRIDFKAEVEDGGVRVRVRDRADDDLDDDDDDGDHADGDNSGPGSGNSGPGSANSGRDHDDDDDDSPTSTSVPGGDDDDDDSGNSGSGNSGSGNSGSGNSGSGNSGSGNSGSGNSGSGNSGGSDDDVDDVDDDDDHGGHGSDDDADDDDDHGGNSGRGGGSDD